MADIAIPPESERIALEDGRPNVTWYRLLARLLSQFNTTQRNLSDAGSGLTTKAAKSQTVGASFTFAFFEDGTQRVIINSPFAWSITNITARTRVGTVTVTPSIDGAALSGGAIAASTTEATEASAGDVAAGADVELAMSSTSADCEGLTVTLAGTRELA